MKVVKVVSPTHWYWGANQLSYQLFWGVKQSQRQSAFRVLIRANIKYSFIKTNTKYSSEMENFPLFPTLHYSEFITHYKTSVCAKIQWWNVLHIQTAFCYRPSTMKPSKLLSSIMEHFILWVINLVVWSNTHSFSSVDEFFYGKADFVKCL